MLTVHHLDKSFGIDPILKDVSFSLNPGDRVGLIGPNGSGKTTLLRILAGQEKPDKGLVVETRPGLRVGYLAQGYVPQQPGETLASVLQQALGSPQEAEADLARLAAELARSPHDERIQHEYDDALRRLEPAQAGARPGYRLAVFAALGLDAIDPDLPVEKLSGGQKTRLALALVLVGEPHLLLLDEPTNHLDIEMLEWLEGWLAEFRGAALIVSHDRTFLDNTVSRILDLDPESRTLREYAGSYTDYLDQYLAEREKQVEAYKDQAAEIRRMRADIARTKQQAAWVEQTTTSRQPVVRRYAKKVARKALSREKKLDRFLDSDERVEKPRESWQMKLEFGEPLHLGQDALALEGVSVGYAGASPLLTGLSLTIRAGQRIALTGPNGAGKTTLLRTIAGQIPPLAGRVRLGASVKLGYMTQEQELLDPALSALETIQRAAPMDDTAARAFLHYFLFTGDDPLRPAHSLSYGERARLSLAVLVAQGSSFLLLDEPVNHLDIPSRARFEQALSQFNGTVLAVVHDRYFIQRFAGEMWVTEAGGVERYLL